MGNLKFSEQGAVEVGAGDGGRWREWDLALVHKMRNDSLFVFCFFVFIFCFFFFFKDHSFKSEIL